MLTADAFGVLPPISRLSPAARCITSCPVTRRRWPGRRRGSPSRRRRSAPVSARRSCRCRPSRYAAMLGEKIARHQARVWLVNTGWTGGPYGTGTRMKIAFTRAMIRAALSGALDKVAYERDAIFNLDVPASCPDVPPEVLNPRKTWANKADYDAQAARLARMFAENFKTFEAEVTPEVQAPAGTESVKEYRAGHRSRDSRAAPDRLEDLLRLQHRVRGAAEHQRVSRVPRVSRGASGAEPRRGRLRDSRGTRARLPHQRDVDLRPQELLLSRSARRAIRSHSTSSRWRATGVDSAQRGRRAADRDHARPSRRGRRQVAARRVSRLGSTKPTSTTTAAACRSSRS